MVLAVVFTVVLITDAYCGAYTVVLTMVLRTHSFSWIALWCLEHTPYCDDERPVVVLERVPFQTIVF